MSVISEKHLDGCTCLYCEADKLIQSLQELADKIRKRLETIEEKDNEKKDNLPPPT